MLELVCVGMSHAHSVQEAYFARQQTGPATCNLHTFILDQPPYKPAAWIEDDKFIFNRQFDDDFRECLDRAKPPVVFTYLIGAEHFILSFINSPRPFDVLMPGQDADALPDGTELIPYDLMLTTCERMAYGLRLWLPHLRELTDLPIYQIGPPPPITGDEFMRAQETGELREQIERYGIASETLRSKVWQINVAAYEHQCAAFQVKLISTPTEALGETQCLLPDYRGHDSVHANAAYGGLLIDRMLAVAQSHASGGG